ncbi:MAG: menaquinone-dependent protoporphyrinogen IX dehydrogenase [Methylobacter sp.]|nr:menaquinone-dependent protoporphyrinogen IX dehydrogenase [Methylobacter sp.]
MKNILIVYSTTDGQTKKICQHLQSVIEQQHQVQLLSVREAIDTDLSDFDKIVLGASIRYGTHHPDVFAFINKNQRILDSKPSAFFSVNLVARKAIKSQPETNPYLIKFLKKIAWQPKQLAVFAGKLDYKNYRFIDRHVISLIMWMTKGPTSFDTNVEYTNWEEVDVFGQRIMQM